MKTAWTRVSLIYFVIIAFLGILMRLGFFNGNFLLNFKHLLHTHSHIAFLGWIYPVLFITIAPLTWPCPFLSTSTKTV